VSPEEIVRAELTAWDRFDVEGIMSHFAEDAVWEFPGGRFAGRDEIREAVYGVSGAHRALRPRGRESCCRRQRRADRARGSFSL
jgi:ketosteroid isomerase-like protein